MNPERLRLARRRRGLTKRALAKAAGLSAQTISNCENGVLVPSEETLRRLSETLRFPLAFFHRDDPAQIGPDNVSFRALTRISAGDRDAAIAAGELAIELCSWIEDHFTLPSCDLPDLREADATTAALVLRSEWRLGQQPIQNLIPLLELHGVRVFSLAEDRVEVDAFSTWYGEVPYVFLNTMKSAERSRFDAAHELGHILMHRHQRLSRAPRDLEKEANVFASVLLMPSAGFAASIERPVTPPSILASKTRWGVSAWAYLHRCHSLGFVSDWHYRQLCIDMKAFRTHEPEPIARETSQLLWKVFDQLRRNGITRAQVAGQLGVYQADLDALVFGLVLSGVPGTPGPTSPGTPDLRLVQ